MGEPTGNAPMLLMRSRHGGREATTWKKREEKGEGKQCWSQDIFMRQTHLPRHRCQDITVIQCRVKCPSFNLRLASINWHSELSLIPARCGRTNNPLRLNARSTGANVAGGQNVRTVTRLRQNQTWKFEPELRHDAWVSRQSRDRNHVPRRLEYTAVKLKR